VPGLSSGDIERLLAAREDEDDREFLIASLSAPNEFLRTEASGVYRVAVHGQLNSGFAKATEAVITAASGGQVAFGVVAWSRLAPAAETR
jgi:hypothetical protein